MSPAPEQRVTAGRTYRPAELVGTFLGGIEVHRQRFTSLAQPADGGVPSGRGRGEGDLPSTGRKPLHLLQLDPVPGRIADHRVETAFGPAVLPVLPHAGEGRLPMQELLAARYDSGFLPALTQRRPVIRVDIGGTLTRRVRPMRQNPVCIGRHPAERGCQRRLELGTRPGFHTSGHPLQSAQAIEQPPEIGSGFLDFAKHGCRLVHLDHIGIRHLLDSLHPFRGDLCAGDGRSGKQSAKPIQIANRIPYPEADERVPAAQVVVQERQRRANGEAVQPQ